MSARISPAKWGAVPARRAIRRTAWISRTADFQSPIDGTHGKARRKRSAYRDNPFSAVILDPVYKGHRIQHKMIVQVIFFVKVGRHNHLITVAPQTGGELHSDLVRRFGRDLAGSKVDTRGRPPSRSPCRTAFLPQAFRRGR